MKTMSCYDLMETVRNTNEWLGASARAFASYPLWSLSPDPTIRAVEAWGKVTERSFARMVAKPDWGLHPVPAEDGSDHVVSVETVMDKPFCKLVHFKVQGRPDMPRRVLVVAPLSGHHATLTRKTVASLLPDCEVYATDWKNARDIPASEGKFDVEDFTLYLVDFLRALGTDIHVLAICQPAPLALAATAIIAEDTPEQQPRSLILVGGPIDPDAAPTDVTDFGRRVTMGMLEQIMIQRVGFKYGGAGRLVYPGLLQLASFISMNLDNHAEAFRNEIFAAAMGKASDHDRHNLFYDEYLSVLDMTSEFYLSTVQRIFKDREIARNAFTVKGRLADITKINRSAVYIVEGENDDISAPGQCLAALKLLPNLPASKKRHHLEPGAGHYGIFAGHSWRNNIRPMLLKFFDKLAEEQNKKSAPVAAPEPAPAKPAMTPVPEPAAPIVAAAPAAAAAPAVSTPVASDPETATAAPAQKKAPARGRPRRAAPRRKGDTGPTA